MIRDIIMIVVTLIIGYAFKCSTGSLKRRRDKEDLEENLKEAELSAIKLGLSEVLANIIDNTCTEAFLVNYCSDETLAKVQSMHIAYHALGRNGTFTLKVARLEKIAAASVAIIPKEYDYGED